MREQNSDVSNTHAILRSENDSEDINVRWRNMVNYSHQQGTKAQSGHDACIEHNHTDDGVSDSHVLSKLPWDMRHTLCRYQVGAAWLHG
jgi:hypothetical protein